jgi:hypothetical protein
MKYYVLIIIFAAGFNSFSQNEKGRSLFFGVNLGTKIANKNYAWRYSGIYNYFGTDQTQLEYALTTPINYTKIQELLGGYDFQVPYDAYSQNIRYTPGLLTGVTMGYQISPNLQISADGNFNKLKVCNDGNVFKSLQDHQKILDHIIEQEPEMAQEAMSLHLKDVLEFSKTMK